jgi:hypothetical protein
MQVMEYMIRSNSLCDKQIIPIVNSIGYTNCVEA